MRKIRTTKLLVIVGAGATRCEATNKPNRIQPPLDQGFFKGVSRYKYYDNIKKYLDKTYGFDPTNPDLDSLESIMSIIYADIFNSGLSDQAFPAFRDLIRILNKRIADTTNNLKPTCYFKLYRIITNAIDSGILPKEITIITFNQDIQIEKILNEIQSTKRKERYGQIFNFPYCYGLSDSNCKLSKPPEGFKKFLAGDSNDQGIRLFKLHGSLNWNSLHTERELSKESIFDQNRAFLITPRTIIDTDMKMKSSSRKLTFPIVIPPVTHKAGILHNDLKPLWNEAETALKFASKIVVFGYSCPSNDFESANLFRRTIRKNNNLKEFSIIDPNPLIFQRYVDLTGRDKLFYFKTADSYLSYLKELS